ncbi:hypothetical protein SAMN04488511_11422 [Pedobacter suwonensis]|uniref:Uncharacterized protein n=1 Tax=Pedobacter suwonensis TaxID=332999 RepID=A0A1I0TSY1_9SPHI|nr:hypothetical protein [Pedobacter suwonensis]SFA54832.1 hypothetical protein SAMN04488511_11422 [Pedobacter suwonensis]
MDANKDLSKEYNDFFNETHQLFTDVKSYTLLYENLGGGTVGVAPLNDIRSALDHLYSFLNVPSGANNKRGVTENYIEAKEHLYRAYYDLFMMICSFLIDEIQAYVPKFGVEVLAKIYPKYFSHVSPELVVILERIAQIRHARQTNSKVPEAIKISNEEVITVLLQWHKELLGTTHLFVEAKNVEDGKKQKELEKEEKTKKKEKLDLILKWVIPFVMLIAGFLLKDVIAKHLFD